MHNLAWASFLIGVAMMVASVRISPLRFPATGSTTDALITFGFGLFLLGGCSLIWFAGEAIWNWSMR